MIGFLKGSLLSQKDSSLLIETGGIGYEVQVSKSIFHEFTKGDFISLWIYTHVREDSLELFGFSNLEEKKVFLALLKVKGIGPKLALQILGSCSLSQFTNMINEENIKALSALPKIGKKTAQQIVLSLKDQISDTLPGSQLKNPYWKTVSSALENLGFHSNEIKEALEKVKLTENLQGDLKQALSLLRS